MTLQYQGYKGTIIWDIAAIGSAPIMLGMPWLEQANPTIDWEKKTVQVYRQPQPRLEKINVASEVTIPEEYNEFLEMFEEEAEGNALPEHQPWDHEIPIKEEETPEKQAIYPLTPAKLENLAKGFIRESSSPVGYPILFVPKKDGEQRLCVDYRKLNKITVKNNYLLPLISELQNRLQGACWFTKFDIPGAYHQIRMKEGEEWKTAFRTRLGHFEDQVMTFGLTNAPATFNSSAISFFHRNFFQAPMHSTYRSWDSSPSVACTEWSGLDISNRASHEYLVSQLLSFLG